MAGILSAAFVFDDDLATELEIEDFLETDDIKFPCKLLLLVGEVPGLVEVLGLVDCTEEIVFLHLDGVSIPKLVVLIFLAAISWENFLLNVRNHIVHAISHA